MIKQKPIRRQRQATFSNYLHNPQIRGLQKKSEVFSKKTNPTPFVSLDGSESSLSQDQRQQFLLLQIKLLKRENTFLKKKLSEMTNQYTIQRPKNIKEKQKQKGTPTNLQFLPLSVDIFFSQVQNLLNSIVNLFKINLSPEQVKKYQQMNKQQIEEECPVKKSFLHKRYFLKRKLERISLEAEQNRYGLFLNLFSQFYQYKEQADKKLITFVDKLTEKAHYLNNTLIQKMKNQKEKKKSNILSSSKDEQMDKQFTNPTVTPRNFKSQYNLNIYSVEKKLAKKSPSCARSPAQKFNKQKQ